MTTKKTLTTLCSLCSNMSTLNGNGLTQEIEMTIVEVYLQQERYNARLHATIAPAWVAVDEDGDEHLICRGHEAKNAEEAKIIWDQYN